MSRLTGKVAGVTGGGTGTGLVTARYRQLDVRIAVIRLLQNFSRSSNRSDRKIKDTDGQI